MWHYRVKIDKEVILDSGNIPEFKGFSTKSIAERVGLNKAKENRLTKSRLEIYTNCQHQDVDLVESGGDAESGPITITVCNICGTMFKQFGM